MKAGKGGLLFALALMFGATLRPALANTCSEYHGPQTMPSAEPQAVFEHAAAAEKSNPKRAVALYKKSVRLKNGFAAKRLAELSENGLLGVERNYGDYLKWVKVAERLGVRMWSCSGGDR